MDRRQLPTIKDYLQKREVQERIQLKLAEVRAKATVTISVAAELSGFSENQLRDWEKRGLFITERTTKQDGKGSSHRQYTPADLEKLAILHDLYDHGYPIGELLREAEAIWEMASTLADNQIQARKDQTKIGSLPVDKRVSHIHDGAFFYPYFASQVLKLSLLLISENLTEAQVGLILSRSGKAAPTVTRTEEVYKLGESLVAWYGRSHWFYTFLTSEPSFEYPSDFRIEAFPATENESGDSDGRDDRTVIIVPRTAQALTLSRSTLETMRRLLAILYEDVHCWGDYFGEGMREVVYPAADFASSRYMTDPLLTGLTDMVVRLGGKTADNRDRWRFCCILLPKDSSLPLQQRSLVVRAQSKGAPHAVATTTVTSENPGLSLRAYLSGHVIYLPEISPADPIIAYRSEEEQPEQEPIRSAIAIPIAGEDGLSIAAMYIVSGEANAFSKQDQRLLRVIGQMIEELLLTYHVREITSKLKDVLASPEIVDLAFKDFLSESDFIRDVEALLFSIKEKITEWKKTIRRENVSLAERKERYEKEKLSNEVVSFIAIGIDQQSSLANRYGDHVARDLSSEIGSRVQKQLISLAKNPEDYRLYHACADRYYIILREMPLEEVQTRAEHLRQVLESMYHIDVHRISSAQADFPQDTFELTHVTVRIVVSWFSLNKLEEVLQRYEPLTAVAEVRDVIIGHLEEMLIRGQHEGGNVVISWDPIKWGYTRYSPAKSG